MEQSNNPSVPGPTPENGQPQPVIRPVDEPAQPFAPEPPANQTAGWGAPQPSVNQQPAAGWGAPQAYSAGQTRPSFFKDWSLKKGLIVGGVAVVVAAAAGAGAYAAGSSTSAADTANTRTGAGPNGQGGFGSQGGTNPGPGGSNAGPGGFGVGMGGLNAAVHSEYVVLQNGSYVTMAGQLGTVTDISASSMTVKSEDGFMKTYALGTDVVVAEGLRQRGGGNGSAGNTLTLADVKSGSSVRVTALKESDKYTAQSIQIVTGTASSTQGTGTTN